MQNWILASRPKTLYASISPVIVGLSLSFKDGDLNYLVALVTILASVLIQIGSNFANDLYDFLKGSDRNDRIGPTRMTQSGEISPYKMKLAMYIIFCFALLLGCYLAWEGGWIIVFIGISSILSAILYTGGPYPFGYYGWGDFFVFIFFGLIAVSGTYFLQRGVFSFESLLLGIAIGSLSTAILIVNNIRDVEEDAKSGKRTLAVRFGISFVKFEYVVMFLISLIIPVILSVYWSNKVSLYLVYFLSPIALRLLLSIFSSKGIALNKVLEGTSKFLFFYSLMISLSIIL